MSKQHALKVIYDYEPRLTIGEEIIGTESKLIVPKGTFTNDHKVAFE